MKNTMRYFLFILIITGALTFSACADDDDYILEDTDSVVEERAEVEGEVMVDDDEESEEEENDGMLIEPITKTPVPVQTNVEVQAYSNGSYSGDGAYMTPEGVADMKVEMTIEGGVVKSVSVKAIAKSEVSNKFQVGFNNNIQSLVVGKKLSELEDFSVVSGSSLTSAGFNKAIAEIKASASS